MDGQGQLFFLGAFIFGFGFAGRFGLLRCAQTVSGKEEKDGGGGEEDVEEERCGGVCGCCE